MRIISGTHKGRHIPVPKNFKARPTTDTAKEGLFNILNNYLDFSNLNVLDLFSGTGNIAYEFASRGANKVDVVEKNPKYASFIKNSIDKLQLNQIKIITGDVFKYIEYCSFTYDLIFADPPYNFNKLDIIPNAVFKQNILVDKGWLVLEHSNDYIFINHPNFHSQREYGKVNFSFFIP